MVPANVGVTFKNQCGVVVRDRLPITIREWNKTKNVSENQVADRYKDTLFSDLMAHFTLPDLGSESENAKQRALVKKWALKKMGELFRAYKNRLWKNYKKDKKPPLFENYLAKQEHNWEEFVRYKESEEAVNLSAKNKKNASEKKYHHHTGRGGYGRAMPKWDAQEAEMELNGITPEPTREGWDTRARNWFLAHGCEYDMKTGNIVESDTRVRVPRQKWIEVTTDIKAGKLKFAPDREKDLLTLVLGNPEKGGRTRGFGPSVPWSLGFPADAETYRSRARAKQRQLEVQNDRMAEFQRRLDQQQRELQQQQREINELKGQRPPDNTAEISQRRDSSVADSEAPPTRMMIDAGPGDPLDGIKETTPCDLHEVFRKVSVKVAVGYVLPAFGPEGEPATWHGNPIPAGYARVGVDSVVPSWETLELDIPGGDGGLTLREVLGEIILWEKKNIRLPGWVAPSTGRPSRSPSPPPGDRRPPSPPPTDHMSPPSPRGYDVDHDIGSPSPSPAPPPPPTKTRNAPSRKRFKSPVPKRSPLPKVPKVPPPRPWDLTVEENAAAVAKHNYDHFHKPKPPAPEPYTEKQIEYATSFLNTPSQYELHEKKDDYTRTLAKVIDQKKDEKAKEKDIAGTSKSSARSAAEKKSSSTSAPLKAKQTTKGKKRKEVPLLGAQPKQSIPALKVFNVPKVYEEHGGGVNMDEAATLAAQCGVTVDELFGAADAALPTADIAPTFVYGEDLVSREQLHKLPTHMRNLHQWYLDACKEKKMYIVASIPWEYYYRNEEIHIEMNELWQLFNLEALDKSLMSCYCL